MSEGETVTLLRSGATLPRAIKLTVVAGPDAGKTVLSAQSAVAGRAKQVDLALTDVSVSSFHVELRISIHGVEVRDLDSRNGTFFEGARIARATLPPGSSIVIGKTTISIDQEASGDGDAPLLASFGDLRGASSEMQALFAWLERLAKADLAIVVEGPAGSGKNLAARAIHDASNRRERAFATIDCAALPGEVAERMFETEAASDGTLHFDAVDELAPELQGLLVRTLVTARARLVSTSRRELRALVNRNRFREDLYARLAQARVVIPPLASRSEDVAVLVGHFLASLPEGVQAAREVSREALADLTRRNYTGEVRELRSVVERAAMVAKGSIIGPADLAFAHILAAGAEGDSEVEPFKDAKRTVIDAFEREYLELLVGRTGENLSRASILSGLDRHHLRELLRKHGLRKT
jgi:DNA-binding NtrC family response regulator